MQHLEEEHFYKAKIEIQQFPVDEWRDSQKQVTASIDCIGIMRRYQNERNIVIEQLRNKNVDLRAKELRNVAAERSGG